MRLIDPQPMETLPEEGEVFVEVTRGRDTYVTTMHVPTYRKGYFRGLYDAIYAWSYTQTCNPHIIHSLLVLKERCEEIARAIREGNADEEDAHALDTLAMEIEAHRTATTKEPT